MYSNQQSSYQCGVARTELGIFFLISQSDNRIFSFSVSFHWRKHFGSCPWFGVGNFCKFALTVILKCVFFFFFYMILTYLRRYEVK